MAADSMTAKTGFLMEMSKGHGATGDQRLVFISCCCSGGMLIACPLPGFGARRTIHFRGRSLPALRQILASIAQLQRARLRDPFILSVSPSSSRHESDETALAGADRFFRITSALGLPRSKQRIRAV